jgi:hypothetical protein
MGSRITSEYSEGGRAVHRGKGVTMGWSPQRKLVPDMQGRSPQANLPEEDSSLPATGMRQRVSLRSPVRKNRTPGSVRGASGNRRPYRDGSSPIAEIGVLGLLRNPGESRSIMRQQPVAFMSYTHEDDNHDGGRLTQFRERLTGEIRMQIGQEFRIFQDRKDIQWGQNWKERIEESLDAVTFFIPILTPSFFKSQYCRNELQRFLNREQKLRRNDLILPVYYVGCRLVDEEMERRTDELAQALAVHQYADWRKLRFEPFDSPVVMKALEQLASQVRAALERPQIDDLTHLADKTHSGKEKIEERKKYSLGIGDRLDYDPRLREAFTFSLRQARQLWENHTHRDLWVDELEQDEECRIHIEKDWSVRYDNIKKFKVRGKRALFMARMFVLDIKGSEFENLSIADVTHWCKEITGGKERDLIRIPAVNEKHRKGFVYFFIPPIGEDHGERIIHTGFRVLQEFAETVKEGTEDDLGVLMKRVAVKHHYHPQFRILVDMDLPELTFHNGSGNVERRSSPEIDNQTGTTYWVYEFDPGRGDITGDELQYKIQVSKA